MRNARMKKGLHIFLTILVMLIVSRFAVRIVDATVQIDGNIPVLVLFLIVVNALIGVISYFIYRGSKQTSHSFRTRRKR